ncbi:hypothetical protein FUAX_48620 (plasmid) [Fulvitalea axinellae]|uniref:FAS1 domain-containing protein n=1 Tax=Fulvitalea axinellae TaxID=1182444 RepID=A0AAU9DML0_9BACT|nr:hypothetical protein FUAX_48620 [Fulvitalea axinellae]
MKKGLLYILAFFAVAVWTSCDSEFEEHFEDKQPFVHDGTTADYILSKPEYSDFVTLLERFELLETLKNSASGTVMAVRNGNIPSFEGFSEDSIRNVIRYHVANTPMYKRNVPTKGFAFMKSLMGKNFRFSYTDEGLRINRSASLAESDIVCSNGVVHVLENMQMPIRNLYEEIGVVGDDYSKYRERVNRFELVFDRENSVEVGADRFGRPIYDSAWVEKSSFLSGVADISHEDSTVSCLMLSDDAIQASFDRIVKRYYESADNVPEAFYVEKDKKGLTKEDKVLEAIMTSTVWYKEDDITTAEKAIDNYMVMTSGYLVEVNEEDAGPYTIQSNGYLYQWKSLGLLASNLMGVDTYTEGEAGEFEIDIEEYELGETHQGQNVAVDIEANEPFTVTYTCDSLMAGTYRLMWSPLSSSTSVLNVSVDGELIADDYRPWGNWGNHFIGYVQLSSYGDHEVSFTTLEPNNSVEGTYGLSFDKITFVPVSEYNVLLNN